MFLLTHLLANLLKPWAVVCLLLLAGGALAGRGEKGDTLPGTP